MSPLPEGLEQAFGACAGELGKCTASWLFVETLAEGGGAEAVRALRDSLGRVFPVLDAVGELWEGGQRLVVDVEPVRTVLQGIDRLVVVGFEARFVDALVQALPEVRFALLRHSPFDVDWDRLISNYGHRMAIVDLESFQGWAGARSALLTFAYGVQGSTAHVAPAWVRTTGEDVRAQFRSLVAWDVLRTQMYVYPRWLVEVSTDLFTEVL